MNILYLLILALAVSLDSFGVGITYGLRKMKIPLVSVMIISLASATMILLSMQIGVWLSFLITPYVAKWIGSIILIIVGIWAIFQVVMHNNQEDEVVQQKYTENKNKIISIELKKFGLVIQILRTPMKADIDKSGNISPIEASVLGLALSLDAFGAGIGAALIGFKPLITASTISGMSGLFILIGLKLGFLFSEFKWLQRFTILPGIILILVGIMKIL